jgi:threonine synthase
MRTHLVRQSAWILPSRQAAATAPASTTAERAAARRRCCSGEGGAVDPHTARCPRHARSPPSQQAIRPFVVVAVAADAAAAAANAAIAAVLADRTLWRPGRGRPAAD